MTPDPKRRRFFVAIVVVLAVVGAIALIRSPGRDGAAAATSPAPARTTTPTGTPRSSPASTQTPSDTMPPAWLAWISGSLPPSFAGHAAATSALGKTVVVAGDTRWLQRSTDVHGATIDRPSPPYEIPIDAFSVDPNLYAPFIPETYRDEVTKALRHGEGVLGESSAKLRRVDVGGTLDLATGSVKVGAVVPDDVAGWSELLVSQRTGRSLGIVDDRYLLSMPGGAMTEPRFAAILGHLLPGDDVRTVPPGGSEYMRIASGVNPPVVMKQVFGEFAAYPRSSDPAFLNMSPAWYDAQIVTKTVPLLGAVTCNRAFFPALVGALDDVRAAGLSGEIHTYSGCYAARTVARSSTAPPSQHAYGAAIDINAPENPYGSTPTMDPKIVRIFERWGFLWGGDFLTPDGMHFEYGAPPGEQAP
jgi:D-alanyl-D-alanine carboxypeptidase